jgi:branched-chain amino acid transport system ATP-binding protein
MSETPILEFKKVDTYYGNIQVLYDINFKVYAGELVCLLGGNASGKSTTLKTILGVCKVKRGSVKLNGERIDTRPSKRIIANGVSIVPENRRIFPHMTVFENLELGAYLQTGSIVLADTAQNLLCNEMMQAAYLGRADVCESPL